MQKNWPASHVQAKGELQLAFENTSPHLYHQLHDCQISPELSLPKDPGAWGEDGWRGLGQGSGFRGRTEE